MLGNEFTFGAGGFARAITNHTHVDFDFHPHTVTVVHFDGVDLSLPPEEGGQVRYDEIKVGCGPCSVSIFDTSQISYDAGKLNEAAARLAEDTKTGV